MNKKTNKILAACLSGVMLLSASPVMAAPVIQEVGEGSAKTDVYLNIDDANIIAGVPTTIIVDGKANENGENIGEYSVSAHGDMAGNKELTIAPESNEITLTQKGKADVTASITQDQTVFSSEDLASGAASNGKVSAVLSAGNWTGGTNFIISMSTLLMPGYTTLYEYDLSATVNDDVKAYYMVPNKNTSSIELGSNEGIATQAESNVIEYNGVRYELSDDDTLVISGKGRMKENVQTDFVDYKGIEDAFFEHYPEIHHISLRDWGKVNNNIEIGELYGFYTENDIYPSIYRKTADGTLMSSASEGHVGDQKEYHNYIDSIKGNYTVKDIKSVVFRTGVENVSVKAFYNCKSLENVLLSDTIQIIEKDAFNGDASLKEINFPDSLESIEENAFKDCKNLSGIKLSENLSNIGRSAFWGCKNITEIAIPENLNTLSNSVFAFTGLKAINIPANITTIENGAFQGSDLISVTLPDTIGEIPDSCFSLCYSLENINIPNSVTSIGYGAFQATKIENMNIPDSVTELGQYLFADQYANTPESSRANNSLKSIILGKGITEIPANAFFGCFKLTEITLGENTSAIRQQAFYNCRELTNVNNFANVKTIESNAFYNCNKLSLQIGSTVDFITDSFDRCLNINIDTKHASYASDNYSLFNKNKTKLIKFYSNGVSAVIPDTVTSIGSDAFSGSNLAEISIPNSVSKIENFAFWYCADLETIKLPQSVTSIGINAFSDLKEGSTIYCESQNTANLLAAGRNYSADKTTVVVAPELFA